MVTIVSKLSKPRPSVVFDTYWKFAAERQKVFFSRLKNASSPWTDDPIIQRYKFTNVYRVTDRVSQFLLRNVIYKGDQSPKETLFRIFLFKLFNKIETWHRLENYLVEVRFDSYNYTSYDRLLTSVKDEGATIYSGAYIMASGKNQFGSSLKHRNHLKLIEYLLNDRRAEKILEPSSLEDLYNHLKQLPSVGSFLAYQLAIDINYSKITDFSEMDFVKAGPGARDGIRKCFINLGDLSEEDAIRWMADQQYNQFDRLNIDFKDLWGRPLQLIDCQNLFCEVDKYSRLAHPEVKGISNRTNIKQKFKKSNLGKIEYVFPEKWRIETD